MTKNILNLFALSATLVAVLMMTHTANAVPIKTESINTITSISNTEGFNLNLESWIFKSTAQENNPILNHLLGCTCAVCLKSSLPSEI